MFDKRKIINTKYEPAERFKPVVWYEERYTKDHSRIDRVNVQFMPCCDFRRAEFSRFITLFENEHRKKGEPEFVGFSVNQLLLVGDNDVTRERPYCYPGPSLSDDYGPAIFGGEMNLLEFFEEIRKISLPELGVVLDYFKKGFELPDFEKIYIHLSTIFHSTKIIDKR
jgi:hypothetical protein